MQFLFPIIFHRSTENCSHCSCTHRKRRSTVYLQNIVATGHKNTVSAGSHIPGYVLTYIYIHTEPERIDDLPIQSENIYCYDIEQRFLINVVQNWLARTRRKYKNIELLIKYAVGNLHLTKK